MKNKGNTKINDELRPEYNLSQLKGAVRGKYTQRYKEGTNLVLLAPDVAKVFSSDEAVNQALRQLMKIAMTQVKQEVRGWDT